jgi:hypothetical protein
VVDLLVQREYRNRGKATTRSKGVKKGENGNEPVKTMECKFGPGMSPDNSPRLKAAVEESLRFFVEANRGNIRKSGKEHIASASYCGGMVDMVMVIKNALGNWGVDQLLTELESCNSRRFEGGSPEIRIRVAGGSAHGGLGPEDAKELGEQIVRWIEQRKSGGKEQDKDPMFA